MPAFITDEILHTFAVVTNRKDLSAALNQRYQGIADHLGLYLPFVPDERDDFWRSILQDSR